MTYRFGPFELDADGYRLAQQGDLVRAEPRVLEVLAYLVAHRDRVVGKEELVRQVWGGDFVSDSSIARAVSEARAALGDTGEEQRWIATVYGRGYRFVAEVEEAPAAGVPASSEAPVSGDEVAGDGHEPVRLRPGTAPDAGLRSLWTDQRGPPQNRGRREGAAPPAERERSAQPLEEGPRRGADLAELPPRRRVDATAVERGRRRERWAWVLVGAASLVAVALAVTTWSSLERAGSEAPGPFWAELNAPPGTSIAPVIDGGMAVSPNGARIALVVLGDRDRHLVVRDLEAGETKAFPGTEGATHPFWSPDDRWIGFFAGGKVKKVPASGGAVQSLADAPHGRGGTWSSEGFIVYAPGIHRPLFRIPDSGGEASPITELEAVVGSHRFPHLLPGGRHVLFDFGGRGPIGVSSVEGPGGTRILVGRGGSPQYADGFLFRVEERTLIAQPFDVASLELSGPSSPLAHDLEEGRGLGNFSVSEAGTLAWREDRAEVRQLVRFDREGRQLDAFGEPGRLWTFDFSRDGRRVLMGRGRQEGSRLGWDLWVMDLDRRQSTRVTFSHAIGLSGAFSPDGERIAASTWDDEGGELWLQPVSGAGGREHLLDTTVIHYVREWSPDGRTLLGREQRAATSLDIVHLAVDDPGPPATFLGTPYEEAGPRLTPDGEWIAYASDESGQWEVYVSDFPARRGRWKISRGGLVITGGQPLLEWGPSGSAVYFATGTGLARVGVTRRGERLEVGETETLPIDCSRLGPHRFLVDSDTILALAVTEESVEEPIRIVRHWRGLLEDPD